MRIRLIRDVLQAEDAPTLLIGMEFDVVEGAEVGPRRGDKPGFLTVQTGDGNELQVYSPEFEIVSPLRLFAAD